VPAAGPGLDSDPDPVVFERAVRPSPRRQPLPGPGRDSCGQRISTLLSTTDGERVAAADSHHVGHAALFQPRAQVLHLPRCTTRAPSALQTDSRQVRLLSDELFALTPTPVVALNRAIAISWHEGPRAGLDQLEALADEPGLARQHHRHAARGHILGRLGRHTAAAEAYRRASEPAQTPAEIAYLSARAEEYTTPG